MYEINSMFHMDADYMWRWYITNADGSLLAISAKAFFAYEDARRDAEIVHSLGFRRAA
jgi:hypothetical protein